MNGITKETVIEEKKSMEDSMASRLYSRDSALKNLDNVKNFQNGIANQCFAMLSGIQFECD
jgi:hypothetical protein